MLAIAEERIIMKNASSRVQRVQVAVLGDKLHLLLPFSVPSPIICSPAPYNRDRTAEDL